MLALQSLVGVVLIPLAAWLLSENRASLGGARTMRIVLVGLVLQFAIGGLLFAVPQSRLLFDALTRAVVALQEATEAGLQVVFGYLSGGPAPFDVTQPENLYLLGLRGLPLILLMSVLSKLLYHWGVLQRVVLAFTWCLRKTLGVGGALGTATAANIFVGMVEAPLLIRPYLRGMGRGALFATMTAGMATVAGTMMVLYAFILEPVVPGAAGHILAASVMSAPAALMIARLMVPDGFGGEDEGMPALADPPRSSVDAVVQGTQEGVTLLVSVAAMLVVMVALVALANSMLSLIGDIGGAPLTMERLFGWAGMPLAWIIGIPWSEAAAAGSLIGVKVILNEFIGYLQLAAMGDEVLSPRSRLIVTYAMCGFANFASLGIMIGGLVAMAPERREDIVQMAPKTVLSGLLATLLTGAVVGTLTPLLGL